MFFDASHSQLASIHTNADNHPYSVTSALGIGSVTFTPSSDFEGVDTLIFRPGASAVPEPASLLLVGTGLVGLVRFARARR